MATAAWSDAGSVAVTPAADATDGPHDERRRRLLARMQREGYRYDFFQLVRLLRALYPEADGTHATTRRDAVRLVPDTALVFPAGDVRRVRLDEDTAEVTLTFMGLYGIGSPLPEFFYEPIATEHEDLEPLRAFLDLFNHRLYAAFYRAWAKYRPELQRTAERDDPDSCRSLSLAGLGTPGALEAAPVPRALLLAFAGRLAPRTRNAEGLRHLTEAHLGLPVAVVENVPRWVAIGRRPEVGGRGGMTLGGGATIGRRVFDRMGQCRLQIGPMPRERFLALLPHGEEAGALQWLTQSYLGPALAFDVELRLDAADLPPTRLGDRSSHLGWNACLSRPPEGTLSRIVDYSPA